MSLNLQNTHFQSTNSMQNNKLVTYNSRLHFHFNQDGILKYSVLQTLTAQCKCMMKW
jgi:hypothetical protein